MGIGEMVTLRALTSTCTGSIPVCPVTKILEDTLNTYPRILFINFFETTIYNIFIIVIYTWN